MIQSSVFFSGLSSAKYVFASDLDETYHDWVGGNRKSKEIANRDALRLQNQFLAERQHDIAFIPTTSLDLKSFKKRIELLDNAPLDGFIGENGKAIYLNTSEKPAQEWLDSLTPDMQDSDWLNQLKAMTGYTVSEAKKIIKSTLQQNNYRTETESEENSTINEPRAGKTSTNTPVRFEFLPTHSAFDLIIKNNAIDEGKAEAKRLTSIMIKKAKQQGIQLQASSFDMPHFSNDDEHIIVVDFAPKGITKGTALAYVTKKLEHLQAVITAGDNELNDIPLLSPKTYQNKGGQSIPNFPIAMPTRPDFVSKINSHPNLTWGAPGDLKPALVSQLKKLNYTA